MKRSPEDLEKFIHQTLRSLPDRRAPRSLESRVFAAIEARAALPWWKQSFARWPVAARAAFLLLSALALIAVTLGFADAGQAALVTRVAAQFAWVGHLRAAIAGTGELCGVVFRAIPPLWLYGSLAALGALYVALLGIGATAYRTLYASR